MVDGDNLKGERAFVTRVTMSQSVVFTCDLHFEPFWPLSTLCTLQLHSNETSTAKILFQKTWKKSVNEA
jgi:hypothetical protein